jgi:hypothetical protein
MVEIGKRDLVGGGRLGMREFEDGRSYVGVDLARLAWKRPKIAKRSVISSFALIIRLILWCRYLYSTAGKD